MLAKRFCFHRLLMALLKFSPPGINTLSPTVRPEMDISKDSSRYFVPTTLIPPMTYSLGVFELGNANNSGSTDTGRVVSETWASIAVVINKKQQVSKKTQIGNLLS